MPKLAEIDIEGAKRGGLKVLGSKVWDIPITRAGVPPEVEAHIPETANFFSRQDLGPRDSAIGYIDDMGHWVQAGMARRVRVTYYGHAA